MKHLRVAVAAAIAASTSIVLFSTASATTTNPNDASYWRARTEHPSQCYKHDPPTQQTAHGSLTDAGKAVVLNEFDPSWPGDHWELLVVKSGSVDNGDGPGNTVYEHPVAGQAYYGPLNGGGEQGAVSHWIVCKGTTPDVAETSVSWVPTDGTCASPEGTLAVEFDGDAVTYDGDPAGPYANGTTVNGSFSAKPGYTITGAAGPFSHDFAPTDPPCDATVTPAVPGFVDPTCAAPTAQVTGVDDTAAVDYEVTGTVAPGETVKVTATAKAGYVLDPEAPAMWEFTFDVLDDDACVIDANPVASIEAECGLALLTFSNPVGAIPAGYTAETADFTYRVDGVQQQLQVAPNGSVEVPLDFAEDSGTHTVQLGDEPAVEIESNCELDEVTATAPTFVDPTCAAPTAQVTGVDDTAAVDYEVTGTVAPGETVKVTATAKAGYVLDPEAPAMWEFTFDVLDDDACVIDANPVASIEAECGSALLTFSNPVGAIPAGYTAETADFTYRVDGVQQQLQVAPNGSVEVPLDFAEDSGTHTVQLGDEPAVEIESNCELDEVTATAPTFVDPTCDDSTADLELPTVAGVSYQTEGTATPGAAVKVTATANEGYVLVGVAEWTHDYPALEDLSCEPPQIEPPTTPPTTVDTTPPTTVDTTPPTTVDTTPPTTVDTIPTGTVGIGQAGPTVPAAQLPKTGSDATSGMVTMGALLLLAGAVMIGATRRRATNPR